jgi:hypothetical protein
MTLEENMQLALDAYEAMYPGCKAASVHLMLSTDEKGAPSWRASTAAGVGTGETPQVAMDKLLVLMGMTLTASYKEALAQRTKQNDVVEEIAEKMRRFEEMGLLPG